MTTLVIRNLEGGWGNVQVLRGVNVTLRGGEVVTLLGRNGTGRSTTCKAIMGLLPGLRGSVRLDGRELCGLPSHEVARAGIGYVPEERLIFTQLTVDENLRVGHKSRSKPGANGSNSSNTQTPWTADELYGLFPRLRERRHVKAGVLSGGEQQMLTIFRTLLGNPDVILIDEPTEGLAPMMVDVVGQAIVEMRRRGLAVLLVEQKLTLALRICDRVLVMGHGHIVFDGSAAEFRADPGVRREWLEVA